MQKIWNKDVAAPAAATITTTISTTITINTITTITAATFWVLFNLPNFPKLLSIDLHGETQLLPDSPWFLLYSLWTNRQKLIKFSRNISQTMLL